MTSNLTPGTWKADEDCVYTTAKIEGNVICEAPRDELPDSQAYWAANAKLLASAPLMYEYVLRRAAEGDTEAAAIIEGIGMVSE